VNKIAKSNPLKNIEPRPSSKTQSVPNKPKPKQEKQSKKQNSRVLGGNKRKREC